jgi:hypothetical protein
VHEEAPGKIEHPSKTTVALDDEGLEVLTEKTGAGVEGVLPPGGTLVPLWLLTFSHEGMVLVSTCQFILSLPTRPLLKTLTETLLLPLYGGLPQEPERSLESTPEIAEKQTLVEAYAECTLANPKTQSAVTAPICNTDLKETFLLLLFIFIFVSKTTNFIGIIPYFSEKRKYCFSS